jgi:hypothetical protein
MSGLLVNDSQGNIKQTAPKGKFLKGDIFEAGCGTKFFAGFAFQFEAPGKTRSPSLKFPGKPAPKNSEISGIFQSHNLLSTRCLQKTVEASIYNSAGNSENFGITQSHNLLSTRHLQKPLKSGKLNSTMQCEEPFFRTILRHRRPIIW